MIDQDYLKKLFRELIDETENNEFYSTEELIEYIANEFEKKLFVVEKR